MKYFVQNQYHILKAYFQYDDQRIAEENCGEPSGFPLHLIDSEMNPQYIDLRLIPKNENKNIVSLDHLQTSLILEEGYLTADLFFLQRFFCQFTLLITLVTSITLHFFWMKHPQVLKVRNIRNYNFGLVLKSIHLISSQLSS